ncbi:MAG: hypothetical protein MR691_04775, partial [Clostridium sp.]|nr:hypothetical protein [Clostridium sp.]
DAAAWADWEDIVQDKELNLDNTYNFMIDYMKEFNSTYNSKDLAEMIEILMRELDINFKED